MRHLLLSSRPTGTSTVANAGPTPRLVSTSDAPAAHQNEKIIHALAVTLKEERAEERMQMK
jgi:hypothetical protein